MALFDRFRKKLGLVTQKASQSDIVAAMLDLPSLENVSLRGDVTRFYELGVDPIRTIMAMIHGKDRNLITDTKKLAGIWLGINDLLDRDDLDPALRNDLVGIRDVLGKSIADTGEESKIFIDNYRESTRQINEMKVLQSYKLTDEFGQMQLAEVICMVADIENERANNPGSMAQDISEEKMAKIYLLIEHWDDPQKLNG